MNVYKLSNPSDDWSFEAPSHLVAWLVATYVGNGKTPASCGDWQSGFYLLGGDPQADFMKEFGMQISEGIEKHKAEFIAALRSFIIKRKDAPAGMDRAALAKWNDEKRSSMSNYGGYANELADSLEKAMAKAP